MVTRLKFAPVRYVLAVLRFPILADFDRFAGEFQGLLRAEYPLSGSYELPQFHFEINESGVNVSQEHQRLWQFSNVDKTWAVVLGAGSVGLHTNTYTDHADFIARFAQVVQKASEPARVGVTFVEGLGLRYVDLVAPRAGETPENYLEDGILPSGIRQVSGLDLAEGVHIVSYRTSSGLLRFQVLRKPPSVLPAEVITPLILESGWVPERPEGDFVVIDIDHGSAFQPPLPIAELDLEGQMVGLRDPISDIFGAVTTSHARAVWNGEA